MSEIESPQANLEAASPSPLLPSAEAVLEDEDSFGTPPDSPDDVKIKLPHEIEVELQELEEADDFIKKNQESIAKSAESVRLLQETMSKLIQQSDARRNELESRTFKLKEMKKEIEEISLEAIAHEEEELQKIIKHEVETDNPEVSGFSQEDEDIKKLVSKFEEYKDDPGLEFSSGQGWIEFKFTELDSASPDTPYTCTIRLGVNNDQYTCITCDPEIGDMGDLIKELNSHLDPKEFVYSVRKKFAGGITGDNS